MMPVVESNFALPNIGFLLMSLSMGRWRSTRSCSCRSFSSRSILRLSLRSRSNHSLISGYQTIRADRHSITKTTYMQGGDRRVGKMVISTTFDPKPSTASITTVPMAFRIAPCYTAPMVASSR